MITAYDTAFWALLTVIFVLTSVILQKIGMPGDGLGVLFWGGVTCLICMGTIRERDKQDRKAEISDS